MDTGRYRKWIQTMTRFRWSGREKWAMGTNTRCLPTFHKHCRNFHNSNAFHFLVYTIFQGVPYQAHSFLPFSIKAIKYSQESSNPEQSKTIELKPINFQIKALNTMQCRRQISASYCAIRARKWSVFIIWSLFLGGVVVGGWGGFWLCERWSYPFTYS